MTILFQKRNNKFKIYKQVPENKQTAKIFPLLIFLSFIILDLVYLIYFTWQPIAFNLIIPFLEK